MTANALSFLCLDETATARIGEALAAILLPGDLVTLAGDLGAGKSVLARAILRWMAGDPDFEATSPTFSLVHVHDTLPIVVAHADFYRLESPEEAVELGLDEALESGIAIVEWPDRGDLPMPPTFSVAISQSGAGGRTLTISADDSAGPRLARLAAMVTFLDTSGLGTARRSRLQGDASTRRYERLATPRGPAILMDAPRQTDEPLVRDNKTYRQLAGLAEDVVPFIAVDGWLRGIGIGAPDILAFDVEAGLVVLEDLGSDGVLDADGAPIPERYKAVTEVLSELSRHPAPDRLDVDGRSHSIRPYDLDICLTEVSLFADWFVPFALGIGAEDLRDGFLSAWSDALTGLPAVSPVLTLRDCHSPNLIWRADRDGIDRVGLIDFQDALAGHPAYDVASLCQDARVTVSADLEGRLRAAYRDAAAPADWPGFEAAYAVLGSQRLTKILGIFVRLLRRDGKTGYLQHMPRLADYLGRNLDHPALSPVAAWHRDHLPLDRLNAAIDEAVARHDGAPAKERAA